MHSSTRRPAPLLARAIGAGALLASGAIHLDLYLTGYRSIPTIGPLFLVQTISTFAVALVVLGRATRLVAANGALLAVGTLAGYLLSRAVGLFGFREVATTAGLVSGLLETTAFVLLGYLAVSKQTGPVTAPASPAPLVKASEFLSSRLAVFAVPLIGVVALALSLIAGVGGTSGPNGTKASASTASTAEGGATITISNFAFSPAHLTVHPGEQVRVHNEDSVAHTATAVPGSTPFGKFDTGDIGENATKSFTAPMKDGTYQYYCSIHNFMTGTLTVSG